MGLFCASYLELCPFIVVMKSRFPLSPLFSQNTVCSSLVPCGLREKYSAVPFEAVGSSFLKFA